MPLEYVKSERGNDLLLAHGELYRKNSRKGDTIYWLCTKEESHNCRARCITKEDELTIKGEHSHVIKPEEAGVRKFLNTIKLKAKETTAPPSQIIASSSVGIGHSVASSLPSPKSLTRTINYRRLKERNAPANPTNLRDLILPQHLMKIANDEEFLLFDSGPLNGEARTNNQLEGWNRRFNAHVGISHPNFWIFLQKLKEEQAKTELEYNQLNGGSQNFSQRKKYRDLNERLVRVVQDYGKKPLEEYLTGIASNLSFAI